MPKIADVKCKSRSKRKPLRDVSNATTNPLINKSKPYTQPSLTTCGGGGGGGGGCSDPVDWLLLVHSDLSTLIHQIDELVVQAVEKKVRNTKEIESFTTVLQEIQTSLKPWIPRFQKALSTRVIKTESSLETSLANMKITPSINEETNKPLDSPYIDKLHFLVSPSPLVSWRAGCAADGGKNLFMLTPLPKPTPFTSRLKKSSKSVFEKITNDVTVGPVESVYLSPEKSVKRNDSIIVSTPYAKMSPPKSCIMLEPAFEYRNKDNGTKNTTVKSVGGGGSGDCEPSSCQPSDHLALKYPELFGIRPVNKLGNTRKVVEASPRWCMSPPKTCVLLEPGHDLVKDGQTNLPPKAGAFSRNEAFIESTPMCKDLDTTVRKGGKRAGENTLKKELWTRFEAATAHGFHFKASVDQETAANDCTNKGFMDLLEEVSCDDTDFFV